MFERSEAILTTLEQYRNLQKVFATPAADDKPIGIEQYFAYMELLYRIQVLECFRNLEQTAPVSAELPVLSAHYIAVDALVSHLLTERRYRPSQDKEIQQARDTARQALGLPQALLGLYARRPTAVQGRCYKGHQHRAARMACLPRDHAGHQQ